MSAAADEPVPAGARTPRRWAPPAPSLRMIPVIRRNFMVWRKLAAIIVLMQIEPPARNTMYGTPPVSGSSRPSP